MAEIRLEGIAHSYDGGETWALRPITLTWEDGKAYAILGPSGCGKTTLLNIMSGLVHPSRGRILMDGQDVTHVPTTERNIAQVFQFPVLYDTMTVRQNLAFPLRNRGYAKATVNERVTRIAGLLGLADDLDTKPHRLRADLQQIVSLGRGLVREDVAAILFDEPLTVIDPTHKWELRSKLKQLHRDIGHTLIYVTHDQTEALTFADEVIVLNEGAVVQAGRPSELFESPTHEFVGHFIGSPGMNFLDATIEGGQVLVGPQRAGVAEAPDEPLPPGPVRVGVRPESVTVGDVPTPPGLRAEVTMTEQRGAFTLVHADVEGSTVIAKMPPEHALAAGSAVHLHFAPDRTLLLRDGVVCGRVAAPRVEVGA
jgi:glycerol transport system ATP-binding protein